MGTIYKQALFTITAAGAVKASEGFLIPKAFDFTSSTLMAHLPFFVDGSPCGEVHIIYHDERYVRPEDSQPLFSRGWAQQEMLLSPRMLVFDANQLLLNCSELRFKPVRPTYLSYGYYCYPDIPSTVFGVPEDVTGLEDFPNGLTSKRKKDNASIWRILVNEYSRRDLSFFGDRLPALAGIANELSALWGDRYLAGFWESSIIQQLAWRRDWGRGADKILTFGGVNLDKPTGWPSWSWSTVSFGVNLSSVKYPNARMLSCQVEPAFAGTPFGQVKHAMLILKACIFDLQRPRSEPRTCPGGDQCSCGSHPCNPVNGTCFPFGEVTPEFSTSRAGLEGERLVFLGWHFLYYGHFVATFLVVEERPEARYRRIGHALLKDSWQRIGNFFTTRPKEVICIE